MKKWVHFIFIVMVAIALVSCAGAKVEKVSEEEVVKEDILPDSVMMQSRKDAKESAGWEKFDKSGQMKFLQVEHTAPASVPVLDGSYGERLIEVKVDSAIEGQKVAWTLENKGPFAVWVVVTSDGKMEYPLKIEAEASETLETTLMDGYSYIVVDSVGGQETSLTIKAKYGDTDAKTVRGKNITVIWY